MQEYIQEYRKDHAESIEQMVSSIPRMDNLMRALWTRFNDGDTGGGIDFEAAGTQNQDAGFDAPEKKTIDASYKAYVGFNPDEWPSKETACRNDTLFKPNNWQLEVLRDQSPVVLLHGTANGGKSRVAGESARFRCATPRSSILSQDQLASAKAPCWFLLRHRCEAVQSCAAHPAQALLISTTMALVIFYGGMANQKREKIRDYRTRRWVSILFG